MTNNSNEKINLGFSILRQTHLIACCMLIFSVLGSIYINPVLINLVFLVCFGLFSSAIFNFCPMMFFLKFMPWNKGRCEQCS